MKRLFHILGLVIGVSVLSLTCSQAFADQQARAKAKLVLKQYENFDFLIDNQLRDDCLPRPVEANRVMKEVFLSSDIHVAEGDPSLGAILVQFFGYEMSSQSCVASIRSSIRHYGEITNKQTQGSYFSYVELDYKHTLIVGPKSGFQTRVVEVVRAQSRELAAFILEARRGKR